MQKRLSLCLPMGFRPADKTVTCPRINPYTFRESTCHASLLLKLLGFPRIIMFIHHCVYSSLTISRKDGPIIGSKLWIFLAVESFASQMASHKKFMNFGVLINVDSNC